MKSQLIFIFILAFCIPSVLKAQKCYDYACNIDKARKALNQKNFKEALAYAKAAKAYPNANVSETDILIYEIFERIEAQKTIAEEATKLAKSEAEKAKIARKEALLQKDTAIQAQKDALLQKKKAEKTARAAENSAVFLQTQKKNPALAMRMMYYNYMRHPENNLTRDLYQQTITDPKTAFLLQVILDSSEIKAVAFSPDSKKVVVATKKNGVKLWDISSGKAEKTFRGHTDAVTAVAFSPDGKRLLTGSADKTARLWNLSTGQSIKTITGHNASVVAVAFTPDGKKILACSEDGFVTVQAIDGNDLSFMNLGTFKAVAFSPDGKKILTGYDEGEVSAKLWDVESGKFEKNFQGDNTSTNRYALVEAVAFSGDGQKVLTIRRYSHSVFVWDIETGKVEKTLSGVDAGISVAAFSSNGQKVIAGGSIHKLNSVDDGTAYLWNTVTGEIEKTFIGFIEGVNVVAFSPDGKMVLTAGDDQTVRFWDIATEKSEQVFHGQEEIRAVAFSPDGKKILTGGGFPWGNTLGEINMLKLWDAQSGREDKTFIGNTAQIESVGFLPDGKKFFSKGNDFKIWNLTNGKVEKRISDNVAAFTPNIDKAITTENNIDKIRLWDIAKRKIEKDFSTGFEYGFKGYALSPDGKEMLTLKHDTCLLWNLSNLKIEKGYAAKGNVVVFSPDGKKMVTNNKGDNAGMLWDLASGQLEKTFIGHTREIAAIAFSPDGKKILTGSRDAIAKLWDLESGNAERTYIGHKTGLLAVAFSADGKKILTGSRDSTARLWDIVNGSVEGWTHPFSLYEMANEGLKLEEVDTPQYQRDKDSVKALIVNPFGWAGIVNSADGYGPPFNYGYRYDDIESQINAAAKKGFIVDPLTVFQFHVNKMDQDKPDQYELCKVLIDTLEHRYLKESDAYQNVLVEAYAKMAKLALLLKKFSESENDIRLGLKIDPTYAKLHINLAPILLLQGKFKEAKTEYEQWKDKEFYRYGYFVTYNDTLLRDLDAFEEAGIIPKERAADVVAIRKLLEKKE